MDTGIRMESANHAVACSLPVARIRRVPTNQCSSHTTIFMLRLRSWSSRGLDELERVVGRWGVGLGHDMRLKAASECYWPIRFSAKKTSRASLL